MEISEDKANFFVEKISEWGKNHYRNFPWRNTRDPFKILIAEMMLQRTNANQVQRVYEKFMDKYGSPKQLASADVSVISEDLGSLGLAYRAERLKNIAEIIVKRFHGKVPEQSFELQSLPGVGRYISNAVLCFAFGMNIPLVDSNIIRVMRRVFSLPLDRESRKDRQIWDMMAILVSKGRSREFNYALLDFSKDICRDRAAAHEICPVKNVCDFYQRLVKMC